ncbi:hypothetical protein pipiens_020421, partial [Culex pipiens pipiens]
MATAVLSNVTLSSCVVLAEVELDELQANLDGSVAWKEVYHDELLGLGEDQFQFVDLVLGEGDCELELIQEVYASEEKDEEEEIDPAGNENALCNEVEKTPTSVKRKNTYEGPKNNRRYNVAGKLGFKCGVCLLRFAFKTHLFRHLLLKHRQDEDDRNKEERIYARCQRCMKTFRTIPELAEHLRQVHKGTFFCGNCLRMFKDKASLNRHRKLHAGMNPYVCDVCDKECSHMSHLIFHRKSHFTDTNPSYPCPHCSSAFSSSGNRQKHIARVHTLEKRHQCPKCPQSFIYSRQLKAHLNLAHVPQTLCQDCNKTFKTPTQLAQHREKLHRAVDRPYACDKCPSRFKQSSHLTVHQKSHSGERQAECDRCKKRFLTGSDLRRHQRGTGCRIGVKRG